MEEKDTNKIEISVGVDEVGRGPIAGPVCVCAFALKENLCESFVKEAKEFLNLPLRDSKKLTKKCREKWFVYLKRQKEKGLCDYQATFVSNEMIDKFGITKCIGKAVNESLKKIVLLQTEDAYKILLDGGLKAPKEFKNQESYVKGDEIYPIISLASIIAKVSRDKVMENYAKEYKEYNFDKNVGYGTGAHYEAIKRCGLTKIHRKSFIH
jgi:ribonuclease HII